MEPQKKIRKVEVVPVVIPNAYTNVEWVRSILHDPDLKDFLTEWPVISTQRISINPRYLHLRHENELLEVLWKLITKGDCKQVFQQQYTLAQFKYFYREQLAEIVKSLLNTESNIKAYVKVIRIIGIVKQAERRTLRAKLFHK